MPRVKITCSGELLVPANDLIDFQGSLKNLSDENYRKLRNSIETHGFASPVLIWKNDGKSMILDGHQRLRVVKTMIAEGYECDPLPVCVVEADSEYQAKNLVLSFVSQYGRVEDQGLYEFLTNSEISFDDFSNMFDIPNLNMDYFGANFYKDWSNDFDAKENIDDIEENLDGIISVLKISCPQEKKPDLIEAIAEILPSWAKIE